jgi:RsiW-degrading membrane proteinase PrsW (M82 family)
MEALLLPVSVVADSSTLHRLTHGHSCFSYIFALVWLSLTALTFAFVYSAATDFVMERACTATLSLCLSLFIFTRFWSQNSFRPIFAFFALRGASLGIVLTLIFELYAYTFSLPVSSTPCFSELFFVMLLVGVKEETAKLFSVLLGSSLSPAGLSPHCCGSYHPSARDLGLAGVAVGYGFMLLENVEYFIIVDLMSGEGARVARIGTGLIRSLFNLHPVLTGLVAARLARSVYSKEEDKRRSHVADWVKGIWPSALIHGLFDFAAVAAEGVAADGVVGEELVLVGELVLVVGTWWVVRKMLAREFQLIENVEGTVNRATVV